LADLRESGAIEQDADLVCFIHRPEYYRITEDESGNSLIGMAEIIVAKHRNGPTGVAVMRFDNEYARFENLDDHNVGRKKPNYIERTSKMNSRQTAKAVEAVPKMTSSDFIAENGKEALPF